MSIPVPVEELPDQIDKRTSGFVITTSADGRPHVAHQRVAWVTDSKTIRCGAGGSTRRNVEANPLVCLLFPAPEDSPDAYSLIVDASATSTQTIDGHLTVTPTHAVLHRPAPADVASGDT